MSRYSNFHDPSLNMMKKIPKHVLPKNTVLYALDKVLRRDTKTEDMLNKKISKKYTTSVTLPQSELLKIQLSAKSNKIIMAEQKALF